MREEMNLEKEDPIPNRPELASVSPLALPFLQKFVLYETRSNYYMVGRDKSRTIWRLLRIDRLENSELNIFEDTTTYSENELNDVLKQIDKENKSTGGLISVTVCYGIVGFFKFLGPRYMLLITERREIGVICGHKIYSVAKTKMITISNSNMQSHMPYSKNENRYKKLLSMVDLTKDFFFSYSYQVMHSLQKNLCDTEAGQFLYESMFVWNEYLTRDLRNNLKNTEWTVALVYGFFHQVKLSISGREFLFTLIARRSRHYAGTRYLRRGIDENGQAANDVETEQIVFKGASDGSTFDISSVVQYRGSIPLFWSQESSRLNMKPDIKWRKDLNYETTKLHFENLVRRYGNPIIILNLIKTREKKPRESILRAEFANAIEFINKDLSKENRLRFLHWDLNNNSQNKATNVLELLRKIAAYAVNLTDIFCCHITPTIPDNSSTRSSFEEDCGCVVPLNTLPNHTEDDDKFVRENGATCGQYLKPSRFQNGVLRTNCIDCLDRTNVAQYAYGWVAVGHQLHALGFIDNPSIDSNIPLADELMRIYEIMGDTLALQYGGSAAHNKIFSERRGQWKPATQSQEFFRTLQRYINNAYMDSEKQDAINVFLGHFVPLEKNGRQLSYIAGQNARSLFRRSQSDGNLLYESNAFLAAEKMDPEKGFNHVLQRDAQGAIKGSSESTPDGLMGEHDATCSRYSPSMFCSCRQLITDSQLAQCTEGDHFCNSEHGDSFDCSNFLDVEWLSSSGNSCEEEASERSSIINSSLENFVNGSKVETIARSETGSTTKGGKKPEDEFIAHIAQKNDILSEYSDSFVQWVSCGEALFH